MSAQPTVNTSYYAYLVQEAGASKLELVQGVLRFVTPTPKLQGLFGASTNSSARRLASPGRRWYLSVDVWSTGFGQDDGSGGSAQQFVTVWAGWPNNLLSAGSNGSRGSMQPVVVSCAPGPRCDDEWVRCAAGTNIDVTDLISPANGGSLAITTLSTGFTDTPESCKRVEMPGAVKYSVFMRYTLTPDHAQPTAQPTAMVESPLRATALMAQIASERGESVSLRVFD